MMNDGKAPDTGPDTRPLLTSAMAVKIATVVGLVAVLALVMIVSGRWLGGRLAMGGFTESTDIIDVFIGPDHLKLPVNTIRTEAQRRTGQAEQIDLVLTWPDMEGYTHANRTRFHDLTADGNLIFIEISQRTMTHDMAGRFEPIYKLLLQPEPAQGPAGLTEYTFKDDSSYHGEVLFVSPSGTNPSFAIRCINAAKVQAPSNSDCQNDTEAGQDLSILTRYSKRLLPAWQDIDNIVKTYIKQHIAQ